MQTYEQGDVVKVPFPYTDRATRQWRPALVVSTARLQDLHGLLWVVMITSAENRGWPDDVPVADLKMAGLPVPSLIRMREDSDDRRVCRFYAGPRVGESDQHWSRGSSSRGWAPYERRSVCCASTEIRAAPKTTYRCQDHPVLSDRNPSHQIRIHVPPFVQRRQKAVGDGLVPEIRQVPVGIPERGHVLGVSLRH